MVAMRAAKWEARPNTSRYNYRSAGLEAVGFKSSHFCDTIVTPRANRYNIEAMPRPVGFAVLALCGALLAPFPIGAQEKPPTKAPRPGSLAKSSVLSVW